LPRVRTGSGSEWIIRRCRIEVNVQDLGFSPTSLETTYVGWVTVKLATTLVHEMATTLSDIDTEDTYTF
jgi:hypothetical protein